MRDFVCPDCNYTNTYPVINNLVKVEPACPKCYSIMVDPDQSKK